MNMKNNTTRRIVWAGLLTALTTVATLVVQVPSPTGGYINAGDAVVLLSAYLLGPLWGFLAAGIGSALADLISGYAVYVPATLIIKGLMALTAASVLRGAKGEKKLGFAVLGSITAELIMIAGYFVFTAAVLGLGWGGAAEIPGNCVQGAFGAIAGTALYTALSRTPYVRDNF